MVQKETYTYNYNADNVHILIEMTLCRHAHTELSK